MNRALFYAAAGILVVTGIALVSVSATLSDEVAPVVGRLLEQMSSRATSETQQFRADVHGVASNVSQARSVVSSVASERTPTPGTNAFTAKFVAAVRAADARREQRLRPVENQLGLLSQQLVDLQQRATSMEIRIQDAIRELSVRITEAAKPKGRSSIEITVALVGIVCSLATLGLGVHKEAREAREAKLKIRELELKLMQGSQRPRLP